jgi:hypothetical protein
VFDSVQFENAWSFTSTSHIRLRVVVLYHKVNVTFTLFEADTVNIIKEDNVCNEPKRVSQLQILFKA